MHDVTGGTVPARVWHDIMLYAHQGQPPLPLPGTGTPQFEQAVAQSPLGTSSARNEDGDRPFFRRVFGILGGG